MIKLKRYDCFDDRKQSHHPDLTSDALSLVANIKQCTVEVLLNVNKVIAIIKPSMLLKNYQHFSK